MYFVSYCPLPNGTFNKCKIKLNKNHHVLAKIKLTHLFRKIRSILDGMVRKLHTYADLTFIWAEIVFFSRWWAEKTDLIRLQVKDLVKEGIGQIRAETY